MNYLGVGGVIGDGDSPVLEDGSHWGELLEMVIPQFWRMDHSWESHPGAKVF